MDVWASVRTDGWMDNWMHGWLSVVVCLLVVDLLGLWRGVKPVSLSAGGLWRGFISRKPLLLLTSKQHTIAQPCIQSSILPYTRPPIHSPTHPCIHMGGWVGGYVGMWLGGYMGKRM